MGVFWIPVVGIIATFSMIIAVVASSSRVRERQAEQRAQVQMKLIDRFGTANEFVDFVHSPEGKQFLAGTVTTQRRATGAYTIAMVLGGLGAAFLVLTFAESRDFLIPAMILLGLAAGFFGAATLSSRIAREIDRTPAP